jgi:hypothetical protein
MIGGVALSGQRTDRFRRHTADQCIGRYRSRHYATGSNNAAGTNHNSGQEQSPCPNPHPFLDPHRRRGQGSGPVLSPTNPMRGREDHDFMTKTNVIGNSDMIVQIKETIGVYDTICPNL